MHGKNKNQSQNTDVSFPELDCLKRQNFDIYSELMKQFKLNEQLCTEWLVKPKPPLQGRTPLEQLSIDADEVMSMLVRMRTGDFS